jgi:phosphatidylglycerophosphate synthase
MFRFRERAILVVIGFQRPGTEIPFGFDLLFQIMGVFWLFDRLGRRRDGTYRKWAQDTPNALCWIRMGVTPPMLAVLVLAMHLGAHSRMVAIWWILLALVLTDGLDGGLVRRMIKNGLKRTLEAMARGQFLDPLSDKVAIVSGAVAALIMIWLHGFSLEAVVFTLVTGIMAGSEAMLALVARRQQRMSKQLQRLDEAPKAFPAGKIKMNLYGFGMMVGLASPIWFGSSLIWIASIMMVLGFPFAYLGYEKHLDSLVHLARL